MKKITFLFTLSLYLILILFIQDLYCFDDDDGSLYGDGPVRPFFIGPIIGYSSYSHNEPLQTSHPLMQDFLLISAMDEGFYYGMEYEYHFGKMEESFTSIIARIVYEDKSADVNEIVASYPELVGNETGWTIIDNNYIYSAKYKFAFITVDALFKINYSNSIPLGLAIGPSISFPVKKQSYETYSFQSDDPEKKLEYDPKFKYLNDGKTLIVNDGDIKDVKPFMVGYKVQLQYEIIYNDGLYFVPEIGFSYYWPIIERDGKVWNISSVYGGISVRYAI